VVQLDEPITYKQIEVALIGKAYVHWTEHHGPTGDQTYTSSEHFFNLRTIFEMEEEIPTCTLPAGIHKFPFQFHLPVGLPSSFRRSVGRIRYYVQGKIIYHAEPKCDEGSCKVKVPITVVEVIDVNSSDLQAPLQKEKQKAICNIMCASAPMTLQVELPRRAIIHIFPVITKRCIMSIIFHFCCLIIAFFIHLCLSDSYMYM